MNTRHNDNIAIHRSIRRSNLEKLTLDELIEQLKQLRKLTDECIEAIQASDVAMEGAINWAGLCCRQASWYVDHEGTTSFRVLIEEASPAARTFCAAVREFLDAKGWKNVEVDTEW